MRACRLVRGYHARSIPMHRHSRCLPAHARCRTRAPDWKIGVHHRHIESVCSGRCSGRGEGYQRCIPPCPSSSQVRPGWVSCSSRHRYAQSRATLVPAQVRAPARHPTQLVYCPDQVQAHSLRPMTSRLVQASSAPLGRLSAESLPLADAHQAAHDAHRPSRKYRRPRLRLQHGASLHPCE